MNMKYKYITIFGVMAISRWLFFSVESFELEILGVGSTLRLRILTALMRLVASKYDDVHYYSEL